MRGMDLPWIGVSCVYFGLSASARDHTASKNSNTVSSQGKVRVTLPMDPMLLLWCSLQNVIFDKHGGFPAVYWDIPRVPGWLIWPHVKMAFAQNVSHRIQVDLLRMWKKSDYAPYSEGSAEHGVLAKKFQGCHFCREIACAPSWLLT